MAIEGTGSALQMAVEAKRLHTRDLFEHKNVVAVGVGFKESRGRKTDEPSVVVGVTRKVPATRLSKDDLVPQRVGSVRTDVQEVGVFRAWQLGPRDRHRPAVPGISCGHTDATAGTFGCLVRRGTDVFLLSNNHVLANTNQGIQGDAILQPGRYDSGTINDQIAVLEQWVPIDIDVGKSECPLAQSTASVLNVLANTLGSRSRVMVLQQQDAENRVDCALARPLSPDLVRPDILYIGTPRGIREGTLGMQVQKTGRTTGHTTGQITQIDVTVQVNYDGQLVNFVDQLMTTGMSQSGDSGSAVLDMDRNVIGLIFAGSDVATMLNPIQAVLNALNVQVVTAP
jgi:hypothetical protein